MACSQTLTGISRDCATSNGGILEVYLANYADVTGVTTTSNKVTAITMDTGKKFKTFQFRRNTSSLSSTYQINQDNGSSYVQTDLAMVFTRMETTKRVAVAALAQAELRAIVKDANGVYWFLGFDEPLVASAGDGLTGTARGDRNAYSITLQDVSNELPYEILVGTDGVNLSSIVE